MSRRGLAVIEHLITRCPKRIGYVVTARDSSVQNDYAESIHRVARAAGLPVFERSEPGHDLPAVGVRLAVAWRWMLPCDVPTPLIVFHDSLLPRYRGFAPLVCALINNESRIGVTALLAGEAYDSGPILGQESITITYPLGIGAAIETVCPCYTRLVDSMLERLDRRDFAGRLQAETEASYSLWRDAEDYRINWQADALQVVRFIDATGFPYLGASATAEGRQFRVLASTALLDMRIENRTPGKVFRLDGGFPIVVCGRGLIRIDRMVEEGTEVAALPWPKLRTRFN